MTIIQSFLQRILNVTEQELRLTVTHLISSSAFSETLMPQIDSLLRGDIALRDELWKFSISLDVPHQLLFDAFCLQAMTEHYSSL